ncbi:MAG: kelch repeat-containing protein [Elusimicrobiota bacterium]|jgi:N-acetylneuraminic acid mutarotase
MSELLSAGIPDRRRVAAVGLALFALLCPMREAIPQQTVCAVAKLELGQTAALEREAFNASLRMTNNLGDLPLSNLRIDVLIKDADTGAPADHLFYLRVTDLQNVQAIDGTGTVQPAGEATAKWLIIPSPGAGGSAASGSRYSVQARMSFMTGGAPRVTTTFPAVITVKPQPALMLEYVLPFEVFGDQPLTSVVESTEPFPLGLRVTNVGAGPAANFTVESAQPKITDNDQGLSVSFSLLGTWLGGNALPDNTLNIGFGDIPPGGTKLAAWSMVSSLAGRFTEFNASFTHAAELGGQLTSLIQGASTYTLIKDVFSDLPGRDSQFDFLVNATVPRAQLEQMYQLGEELSPEFLMESDRPGLTPVLNAPAALTGTLSGSNAVLQLAYSVPVPSNTWVHSSMEAPGDGALSILSVSRADGKTLNPRNVWISKHFNKTTQQFVRRLHVLDYTGSESAGMAMAFNASSLDAVPDPVAGLAVSFPAPGELALSWTASGEDASSGTILGGKYAIAYSTDANAVLDPISAQIVFSTTTQPGSQESHVVTGLLGNAQYHAAVFIADAAGNYSSSSVRVSGLTLAYPPANAAVQVGTGSAALSWDISANLSGAQYRLLLSSAPGQVIADSGFIADLTNIGFPDLSANKTYFISAQARNSGLAESAETLLASATTFALAPVASSAPFAAIEAHGVLAQWTAGGNPVDTEFLAELSTSPDRAPVFAQSGWVLAESFAFQGLASGTTYYGQAKARNRAGVETVYADLGAFRTMSIIVPEAVADLAVSAIYPSSVTLAWTAPANAASYELRWSTNPLNAANFVSGTLVFAPAPAAAGQQQTISIEGGTEPGFYAALRSQGAGEAWSALSNVVGLARGALLADGRSEMDFSAGMPVFALSLSTTEAPGAVVLATATAQGLVQVSSIYELGPESTTFIPSATLTFRYSPEVLSALGLWPADIAIYHYVPGVGMVSVASQTLDEEHATLSAPLSILTSIFGVMGVPAGASPEPDILAPLSSIVADSSFTIVGQVYLYPDAQLSFAVLDDSRTVGDLAGVGVAHTSYSLDGGAYSRYSTPFSLVLGAHRIRYFSTDRAGNVESVREMFFIVDARGPDITIASPTAGSSVDTHYPQIRATVEDIAFGVSPEMAHMSLDGSPVGATVTARSGLAPWQRVATLPAPISGMTAMTYGNRVYLFGGYAAGALSAEVRYAELGMDGTVGAWMQARSLPLGLISPQVVRAGKRIYVSGGNTLITGLPNTPTYRVYFADIQEDSSIGEWDGISIPSDASNIGLVSSGEYLYWLGGGGSRTSSSNTVFYSRICPAGLCHPDTGETSAPWKQTLSMPQAERLMSVASYDGWIYLVGGDIASVERTDRTAKVYGAIIGENGELSSWMERPSLPSPVAENSVWVSDGYLYSMGGSYLNGGVAYRNIYYARLDEGAGMQPWQEDVDNRLSTGMARMAVAEYAGRIFVFGGHGAGQDSDQVLSAPIESGSVLLSYLPETALIEGEHSVQVSAQDSSGESVAAGSVFSVQIPPDILAPRTGFVASSSFTAAGRVYVGPETQLSFSVEDDSRTVGDMAGAGVQSTSYGVDGGDYIAYAGPFTLSVGEHALRFFSTDMAGNSEAVQFVDLTVQGPMNVSSLMPSSGYDVASLPVDVYGSGFGPGSTFELARQDLPLSGSLSRTTDPAWAIGQPTLVTLADGRVLMIGEADDLYRNRVPAFDPVTEHWMEFAPIPTPRREAVAILLKDGTVLVTGGSSSDDPAPPGYAEIYDPVRNVWTVSSGGRWSASRPTATLLPDGRVFILGGNGNYNSAGGNADIYDPVSKTWTEAATAPEQFGTHTATLLKDGRVLVVGGYAHLIGSNTPYAGAYIFDPVANAWTPVADLLPHRRNHAAVRLEDGRVLVCGGIQLTGSPRNLLNVDIYDPVKDQWTSAAPMSVRRADHHISILPDRRLLVSGGIQDGPEFFEIYDPVIGTWSHSVDVSPYPANPIVTSLADGRVMALAYEYDGASGQSSFRPWLYDNVSRIPAQDVVVQNDGNLKGSLALAGRNPGVWDLQARTGDGRTAALAQAFTIEHAVAPQSIGDLAVTGVQDGQLSLSWTVPQGAAAYELFWATYPLAAWNYPQARQAAMPAPSSVGSQQTASVDVSGVPVFYGVLRSRSAQGLVSLSSNFIYAPVTVVAVHGITPSSSYNLGGVDVTVSGSGFEPGTRLALSRETSYTTGTWAQAGDLPIPVYQHASVRLRDGRILLCGGFSFDGAASADVWIYDPGVELWTSVSPMGIPRAQHAATLLPDGRILVAGGYTAFSDPDTGNWIETFQKTAELYNPVTNSWTPTTDMLGEHSRHTATALPDGKVLVVGGETASVMAELYDPVAGTWSDAGLQEELSSGHSATLLREGKVLVTGGFLNSAGMYTGRALLFDPTNHSWANTGAMLSSRGGHRATSLLDGKILVVGGENGAPSSGAEIYDPGMGQWTLAASMSAARSRHTATLLSDGRVLAAWGEGDGQDGRANTVEIYDPASGRWSAPEFVGDGRADHTATVMGDGRILFAGGDGAGSVFSTAWLFNDAARISATGVNVAGPAQLSGRFELTDRSTGTWDVAVQVPDGRSAVLAQGFNIEQAPVQEIIPPTVTAISATGGYEGEEISAVNIQGSGFRTGTRFMLSRWNGSALGTWTSTQDPILPAIVPGPGVELKDGRVFVCGGSAEYGERVGPAAILVPQTGVWTLTPQIPLPGNTDGHLGGHSVTLLKDGKVLVAGGDRMENGDIYSSSEIYDPNTDEWRRVGDMRTPRRGHAAVALKNGKVLVAGGRSNWGTEGSNAAEIYDPAFSGWGDSPPLPFSAAQPSGILLRDGRVLIIGDDSSSVFDPVSGQWSASVPSPSAEGNPALLLQDGKVFLNGQVFDPLSGQWTNIGGPAASYCRLPDGRLMSWPSPTSGSGPVRIFDPNVQAWSSEEVSWLEGVVPEKAAVELSDGRVLFWGFNSQSRQMEAGIYAHPRMRLPAENVVVSDDAHASARFYTAGRPMGAAWDVVAVNPDGGNGKLEGGAVIPSAAGDLRVAGVQASGVNLSWTVPAGGAVSYEVRWATYPLDATSFGAGAQALVPTSANPGETQNFTVDRMEGPPFYAAMRSQGLGGMGSLLSNVVMARSTVSVTSISPTSGYDIGTIDVNIEGAGFAPDMKFALSRWNGSSGGVWSEAGALPSARAGHVSVRLKDGRVLVCGGGGDNGQLAEVQIFDPAMGSWVAAAPMNSPRMSHAAVLLADGRVLVAGGDNAGVNLASAEIYDPAANTWQSAGDMHAARSELTLTLLKDGRALAIGGRDTDGNAATLEFYDPVVAQWTGLTGTPNPRWGNTATLLQDGRVLVVGGQDVGNASVFDPQTGSWSPTNMNERRDSQHTATLLDDGRVMVFGGQWSGNRTRGAELFDPISDSWTPTASVAFNRCAHTAALLLDGKVLIVGGDRQDGGMLFGADSGEMFDPKTSAWSRVLISGRRSFHTATTLLDGRVLLVGGQDDGDGQALGGLLSSVELYTHPYMKVDARSILISDGGHASGRFDFADRLSGAWDVLAMNPDGGSGILPQAFTIEHAVVPQTVTDLVVSAVYPSSVTLAWTAPANAASYELRWATYALNAGNFASGTALAAPAPAAAGQPQSAVVEGLGVGGFYAAIRSQGAGGLWSPLSNVAGLARGALLADGRSEMDFSAGVPVSALSLSTIEAPGSVVLATATSQGLLAVSSIYELGPESTTFVPPATLTFRYSAESLSALGLTPADIAVYHYVPETGMVKVSPQALDEAAQTISVQLSSLASIYGLLGLPAQASHEPDILAPRTSLVLGAGGIPGSVNYVNAATPISFTVVDDSRTVGDLAGVGVAYSSYSIDGGAYLSYTTPFTLTAGEHTVQYRSADLVGNVESVHTASFVADAQGPVIAITSPAAGAMLSTASAILTATYADEGAGLLPESIRLLLDASSVPAQIRWYGAGEPGAWQASVPLPEGLFSMGVVEAGGRVYVAGGGVAGQIRSSVYFASILPDGRLGPWTATTPLPQVNMRVNLIHAQGRIYVLGGAGYGGGFAASYYADVQADGSLGAWTPLPDMPWGARSGFGAVLLSGRVYVYGGYTEDCATHAEAYYAVPCSQGLCHPQSGLSDAPWLATTAMAQDLAFFGAAGTGNRVYAAGGTRGCGQSSRSEVWYSEAGPDGALGAWQQTAQLPQGFANPRMAAGDGTFYVMGGNDVSGELSAAVYYANSGSQGQIDAWQTSSAALPSGRYGVGGMVAGGRLYAMGGYGNGPVYDDVLVAQLAGAGRAEATYVAEGLGEGGHLVRAEAEDRVGNASSADSSFTIQLPVPPSIAPSSGPIGIPFVITGAGFGAKKLTSGKVYFGTYEAVVSSWTDARITGDVPGVPAGTWPVRVERHWASSTTVLAATSFDAALPELWDVIPDSGPMGIRFTLLGNNFGTWEGSLRTQVLFEGTTVPVSSWKDDSIQGTVPGSLEPGVHPIWVRRTTLDGGLMESATVQFELIVMLPDAMNPSTGPIGVPITITGSGFGARSGASTLVWVGASTAAVSSWTDTKIIAKVPGMVKEPYCGPGETICAPVAGNAYPVEIERIQGGYEDRVVVGSFTVTPLAVSSLAPSSGPIGTPITLWGPGFGPSDGVRTQVLFAGATVAITSWSDAKATFDAPGGFGNGVQSIALRRTTSDGGLMESVPVFFEVIGMSPAGMNPSTGPIGIPVTITGSGFGVWDGVNTRVLINGATVHVNSWIDTKISADIPGLPAGEYPVAVERAQGGYTDTVSVGSFTVTPLAVSSLAPSSGPIGTPITLWGPGFGPSDGAWTQVLFAGATVAITSWSDAKATFDAPGGFGNGAQSIALRRTTSDGGLMESAPVFFEVIGMSPAGMNPSTGPIGIPVTITGSGFGVWDGVNTRVLINGATVHVNSWVDTKISADIPGLPAGEYPVAVERAQGGYTDTVSVGSFMVTPLTVSSLAPSSGPIGTPITLWGPGFGPSDGVRTQVLFAGATVAITSWSDAKATFDAPGGFGNGAQSIALRRTTSDGGLMESVPVFFEVIGMSPAIMNPSTGPIGIPVTITGSGFGVWSGQETRLWIGASTVAVTSWTNTKIIAKIPGVGHESYCGTGGEVCPMLPGTYPVSIQRVQGGYDESVFVSSFTLTPLVVSSLAPVQAPIGSSFTLTGTGFGPSNGAYTQVLINGTSAPLVTWTDTKIGAKVPGSLAPGIYPLWIERRTTDGGVQASASMDFEVVVPQISSMTPTAGKAGTSVTLYGSGFGYNAGASYNRVLINGIAAALSSWTDVKIKCIVPDSLAIGTYPVVVERTPAGGAVQSNALEYSVTAVKSVSMLGVLAGPSSGRDAISGNTVPCGAACSASGAWNLPEWDYEAELAFPAAEGGRMESAIRASVELPAGALAEDAALSMRKGRLDLVLDEKRAKAQADAGIAPAGPAVEFGPEGTLFASAATIELPYSLADGQRDSTLAIYWWDSEAGRWIKLNTELDTSRKRVRAKVGHFSLYQPMAEAGRRLAAAAEEFVLRDVYVFPNPARAGAKPTFHVEVGRADSLEIRVYDVSGRKVHETQISGPPGIVEGRYAYEYVWEGRIASGVYFYSIEAKKAGQGSLRKTGKLAVVR